MEQVTGIRKKTIIAPALIFIVFALLYPTISYLSNNDLLFRPVWDIGHYLTIADKGYEEYPCNPAFDYPMGDICGNVGWFPGWPMAVRILSLGHASSGLLTLPYLFAFLGFILFYNLVLKLSDQRAALIATIALAASPSAFYLQTGFPYALMLFLFCAYLLYLYDNRVPGRKILLPVLAFLISFTYPPGFLTAVIPLVMLFNRFRKAASKPG